MGAGSEVRRAMMAAPHTSLGESKAMSGAVDCTAGAAPLWRASAGETGAAPLWRAGTGETSATARPEQIRSDMARGVREGMGPVQGEGGQQSVAVVVLEFFFCGFVCHC